MNLTYLSIGVLYNNHRLDLTGISQKKIKTIFNTLEQSASWLYWLIPPKKGILKSAISVVSWFVDGCFGNSVDNVIYTQYYAKSQLVNFSSSLDEIVTASFIRGYLGVIENLLTLQVKRKKTVLSSDTLSQQLRWASTLTQVSQAVCTLSSQANKMCKKNLST